MFESFFKSNKVTAIEHTASAAAEAVIAVEKEVADASGEFERKPTRENLDRKRNAIAALERARVAEVRAADPDDLIVARAEAAKIESTQKEIARLEAQRELLAKNGDEVAEKFRVRIAPFVAELVTTLEQLQHAANEDFAIAERLAPLKASLPGAVPPMVASVIFQRGLGPIRGGLRAMLIAAAETAQSNPTVAGNLWAVIRDAVESVDPIMLSDDRLATCRAEYAATRK